MVDYSPINSKLRFVATSSSALVLRLTLPFIPCANLSLNIGMLVINNRAIFNVYTGFRIGCETIATRHDRRLNVEKFRTTRVTGTSTKELRDERCDTFAIHCTYVHIAIPRSRVRIFATPRSFPFQLTIIRI